MGALRTRMIEEMKLRNQIIGVDLSRCPSCREGTMIVVGDLSASLNLPRWDSS